MCFIPAKGRGGLRWNQQTGQNFISKCPRTLFLLCQLVWPRAEVGSPQQYPCMIFIDQWYLFYLKRKKKMATDVQCQGINNWVGLFYSLSSCLFKGTLTFCCCHLAMVISWFTSAACKQQYRGGLTSGSSASKQISDALRVINRDCQRSRRGQCLNQS